VRERGRNNFRATLYFPQFGILHGRRGGRIFEATRHHRFLFFATAEDGRLFAETSLHARGRKFHILERGNHSFLAPDLLQRTVNEDGILAYTCFR